MASRCRAMVIGRAAATGLPRGEQRIRAAAAAADERSGQGRRNTRPTPPARGAAAAARSAAGAVRPSDRALLAALLHRLPRRALTSLHLIVRPETVLRCH